MLRGLQVHFFVDKVEGGTDTKGHSHADINHLFQWLRRSPGEWTCPHSPSQSSQILGEGTVKAFTLRQGNESHDSGLRCWGSAEGLAVVVASTVQRIPEKMVQSSITCIQQPAMSSEQCSKSLYHSIRLVG